VIASHTCLTVAAVFAAMTFTACSVDVREGGSGRKQVDIATPVGDLSVRTSDENPDVGLPVYPGARSSRDGDDGPENADVRIAGPAFGLKVRAASYESGDAQERVLEYYRREMAKLGEVTECRGEIDFKGRRDERRPVCEERSFSREGQLVVGSAHDHRMVSVKPRGQGSEIALVHIESSHEG
jgi:hypothetical protein